MNKLIFIENFKTIILLIITINFDGASAENPKNIVCEHKSSKKFLEISCYSLRTYPDSACDFNIRRSNTNFINFSPPEHSSTQISTDPIYFSTICSTKIPVEHVLQGLYEIDVSIFPNISTRNNNTLVTVNLNVLIVNPRISLEGCPDQVEDGGNVTCTCKRRDKSNIKTRLFWILTGNVIEGSEWEVTLNASSPQKQSAYVCISENEFGWITRLEYNPSIRYSNKNEYCKGNKCFSECYGGDELCKNEKVFSCIPNNLSINDVMELCQKSKEDDETFRSNACKCALELFEHITIPAEFSPDETSLKTTAIAIGFVIVVAALVFVILQKLRRDEILAQDACSSKSSEQALQRDYPLVHT